MKYECEICHYIYDSEKGDPEHGFEAGLSIEDLPEDWACPICGLGKECLQPVEDKTKAPMGELPLNLMVLALTRGLWTISGRGSYSVTREIGRTFLKELKKTDMEFKDPESALKSVKTYFIDLHRFARDMEYEVRDKDVELTVKNCRFFGLCKQLEDQGVLITTCPYTNTSSVALEEVTGYRYRINKEKSGYGHKITLKPVSKV